MRRKMLLAATCGAILSSGGLALAQVPGTNLGTPQTQPQPGGGVSAGPGAPTSALESAGTRRRQAERRAPRRQGAAENRGMQPARGGSLAENRGPPPPGGAGAVTGGAPSSGQLAPSGAIRPGTASPGGTGGSSR
jgi:hypothetical protein